MDITTQKFLMGSAGAGGQDYWIINFATSGFNTYVGNGAMDFTTTGEMVIAANPGSESKIFKMDEDGAILWTRSFANGSSGYPRSSFGNISISPSNQIMVTGRVYNSGSGGDSGIAVLNNSNGSLVHSRYFTRSNGAMYGTRHVQLDNTNVVHNSTDTYLHRTLSNGFTHVDAKSNYRMNIGGGGVSPNNTATGAYIQTDGTSIYLMGGIGGPYAGDSTKNYMGVLKVSSTLSPQSLYYYNMDSYPYNSHQPIDFTRVNGGRYMIFRSNVFSSYSAHIMFATDGGGTQWVRNLTNIGYTQAEGRGPYITADDDGNAYVVVYGNPENSKVYILKYNQSGNMVWKREFTGFTTGMEGIGKITVREDALYVLFDGLVCKLPLDGGGVGTYGPYTYSESSYTDSPPLTTLSSYSGTGSYQTESTLVATTNSWTQPVITVSTTKYEVV